MNSKLQNHIPPSVANKLALLRSTNAMPKPSRSVPSIVAELERSVTPTGQLCFLFTKIRLISISN